MLNITCSIWTEFRLNIYTKCFSQAIINVNQIFTPTICDIKSLTGSFTWSETCLKVSLYYILNISKITRLPAITIDAAYLTVKQLLYKLRNNCCISSIRILSATKHIEVTHSIGIKTIMFCVLLCPLFIATFAYGIRRKEITFYTLSFRKIWLISIDRRT